MAKKFFTEPSIDVVQFDAQDAIVTSGRGLYCYGGQAYDWEFKPGYSTCSMLQTQDNSLTSP